MKCEHGKPIIIVVQLDNEYIEDGYKIHLEGCTKCEPVYVERKNKPTPRYLCNMADLCKRDCGHNEEHPHDGGYMCDMICSYNRDAKCEEI